ncbi:MAG: universal stress protein UspA [Chloroflexota bacterium]|nr:MAG: universal stress protein UspA [Chloroflexota bacterium]
MFRKILVPLDGSALAEGVLPHVLTLAQSTGAEVILLQVLEQNNPPEQARPVDPLSWRFRQMEAKTYLEGIQQRLQEAQSGTPIETVLLEGQTAERIIELAHEHGFDLIALSSHGRSGLSGWNVSGVVQKIILRAHTSIFLARAYQAQPLGLTGLRYQHIFMPLDGSQRAENVLPLLASLAQDQQAEILLVHVVAQPEMPRRVPFTPEERELSQRLVELNREEVNRYFDQLKSRLPGNIQSRVVVSDNVITTLHSLAEDELADLVVVSAHGYSATRRYPYGSVSISFIAYGATPLLIIQDLPQQEIAPNPAEVAAHQLGLGGRMLAYDKPSV